MCVVRKHSEKCTEHTGIFQRAQKTDPSVCDARRCVEMDGNHSKYVDENLARFTYVDGDTPESCLSTSERNSDGGALTAPLAFALCRRRIEDDRLDPRVWYELGCECFHAGEFASCEFALTVPCVLDAYGGANEPRLWLRLAHVALALGGDVRERVDNVFDCLDVMKSDESDRAMQRVKQTLALDAAEVEYEWARRTKCEPRPRAEAARKFALSVLVDSDAKE
jgi:hypothetical protein